MESGENIRIVMHSYAKKSLEPRFEEAASEPSPLPETPDSHQTKKLKPSPETPEAPAAMLAIMLRIEKMQEESLQRLVSVEAGVNGNSTSIKTLADSIETLGRQLETLNGKLDSVDGRVAKLEKENASLREKCDELDAYKRRWNLRIAGM